MWNQMGNNYRTSVLPSEGHVQPENFIITIFMLRTYMYTEIKEL